MLAPQHHTNVRKAQQYFEEHLAVGDYYSEHQAVRGEWIGAGAGLLGLYGVVQKNEFLALCENRDPDSGKRLTARTKTKRRKVGENQSEKSVANRRLFYDFTMSPPKSVSIAALVAGDERLLDAHDRAVRVAMKELERFAATRVRRGGENSDRPTANIATAVFRHDTSRALDPHLHSHCIVFNATFDVAETRWKALQTKEMFNAGKYVENVYYHELAQDLRRFGYHIRNKARGDFEIEGLPQSLDPKFSKRHRQIDDQVRELLAHSPQLATRNRPAVRANVAHTQRPWKSPALDPGQLRKWWNDQLSDDERQGLNHLSNVKVEPPEVRESTAAEVESMLRWSEEHLFDRKSVVREHELWRYALERGRGENFPLEALHAATARADYLHDRNDARRLTIPSVLHREREIIRIAREGQNACSPLAPGGEADPALDEMQQVAARDMLKCWDFIILFRGGAGTGKSFTLRAVYDALKSQGRAVEVLAPQRQQVEGLALDGMAEAQTVSRFLLRQRMEKGGVVIVDEAGQIGAKDMLELLAFVKRHRGRVILSGDTRQHGPVQASDALLAIEKYGNLQVAELKDIRRQDPTRGRDEAERQWIAEYKKAVEEAADGNIEESFDRLDEAGALVECTLADRQQKLSQYYLALAKVGESSLVVSPTWDEIHRVNDEVRRGLQAAGLIGGEEWKIDIFQAQDLSDAQKRDTRYYTDHTAIVFNQTARGAPKGTVGILVAIAEECLIVEAAGRIRMISFDQLGKITLCQRKELLISHGDRLQLKSNSKAIHGERLNNGELVTVKEVKPDGRIQLKDGRIVPASYRQFVRGYAVTSYASQGKTVDHVLFSDSSIKAAISSRQWYVTISRGRRGVKIFTTDKKELRQNIARSGARELALDLVAGNPPESITPAPSLQPHKPRTIIERAVECARRASGHQAILKFIARREGQSINQTTP